MREKPLIILALNETKTNGFSAVYCSFHVMAQGAPRMAQGVPRSGHLEPLDKLFENRFFTVMQRHPRLDSMSQKSNFIVTFVIENEPVGPIIPHKLCSLVKVKSGSRCPTLPYCNPRIL